MDVGAVTQIVSTVGFPIAVACYMMLQNDKLRGVINENTLAIVELKNVVAELKNEIEH